MEVALLYDYNEILYRIVPLGQMKIYDIIPGSLAANGLF